MTDARDILDSEIRKKSFRPVYLIFGEEPYLVTEYTDRLKQAIIGEDTLNFSEFSQSLPALETVADLVQTAPLFASDRLVLMRGTGLFVRSAPGWPEMVSAIPAGSHLIFSETQVDKRSALYKAVGKAGLCAEMLRQSEQELKRFIRKSMEQQGYTIESAAVFELYQRTGDDMALIRSEMDKLCAYCADSRRVTVRDVDDICVVRVENQIFRMIQMAADGRRKEAMDLYRDLLSLQEKPSLILYHTQRQINQLYVVKKVLAEGGREQNVVRALGLKSSYIAQKLMQQSRRFSAEQLEHSLKLAVDLEQKFKTGNMDGQIAAEMLLTSISERKPAG
ncbi:MAG: DNA polymerase III subunit delta [Lachnospiraceae bacterium]|jgi:DNA polymerase-3 subunit delta